MAKASPFNKNAPFERSLIFYETMTGTHSNTLLVEFFHITEPPKCYDRNKRPKRPVSHLEN